MGKLGVIYASALFRIAKEKNLFEEFLQDAQLVSTGLNDPDCQKMLAHPHIPASDKKDFFKRAFGESINENFLGLLFLAADKNREAYILPALSQLTEMIKQHQNIVTAEVASAVSFSQTQAESLQRILTRKLNKTVEMRFKVDSSLIGGPYILVDGHYIDWTIKKKLYDLTVSIKEECSA